MQRRCLVNFFLRVERLAVSSRSLAVSSLSCMHQQLCSRSSSLLGIPPVLQQRQQAWRGPCVVAAAAAAGVPRRAPSRWPSRARRQPALLRAAVSSSDDAEAEQPDQGPGVSDPPQTASPSRGPPGLPSRIRRAHAHAPRRTQQRAVTIEQILQPQQQQQQQQQWQPTQPPRQPAQNALLATLEGEVHRVIEFPDSDYKILYFKQVTSCSNGVVEQGGWQPLNVQAALAALHSKGHHNRSSSRSNSSTTSTNQYAAASGDRWLVVTGNFSSIQKDMVYHITGEWVKHANYGWQIRAHPGGCLPVLDAVDPVTFLKQADGVGPATAERIAAALGGTMDSIREALSQPQEPAVSALMAVPRVSRSVAVGLKQMWDDKIAWSIDRQLELQQKAGLTPALASNITEHLQFLVDPGQEVLQRLAANPYELYRVLPGYTLQQADDTARLLGFDPCGDERGAAYLQETLLDASNQAQTSLPWSDLQTATVEKLQRAPWAGWDPGQGLQAAAELLAKRERVVVEEMLPQGPQQQHKERQPQQQQHHHHHHHQQHSEQQHEVFEFKVVQSRWSDGAHVYLWELHKAERDTVDYYVEASRRCCRKLRLHWKQQLQEEEAALAVAGARTHAQRRRSHRRHTEAAAHPAETATSSIPSIASAASLVHESSDSSSSSSSSSGVLQLPLELDEKGQKLVQNLAAELSYKLGKDVELSEGQRVALALSQWLPALALTGGPGCGKTLVSQAVAHNAHSRRLSGKFCMAAPTGRAAQRLLELSGSEDASASTIHRLLGYRNPGLQALHDAAKKAQQEAEEDLLEELQEQLSLPQELDLGRFCEYNRRNPLPTGVVLVDEVSMMDITLAAALFNSLWNSELMLVGDRDQLPPVGAGQPVADALAEGLLPCIDLRQIYRTAANSAIVTSAHAINRGEPPQYSAVWDLRPGSIATDLRHHLSKAPAAQPVPDGGVLLLRLPNSRNSASHVADAMKQAMQQLVPQLKRDMQLDVQVLSPVKNSAMGVESLNYELQPFFNPPDPNKAELTIGSHRAHHCWRVGDRVTHLKNDTQLDVYNGDQGFIDSIDPITGSLVVRYPPRPNSSSSSKAWSSRDGDADNSRVLARAPFHRVKYSRLERADQLQLAWATTVHKAQGGEFPVVLLAIDKAAGRLLKRQLLYTAVSRAKKALIIVGTDVAISEALRKTGVAAGATSSRFRAKLRSARVAAGLPRIERVVFGPGGPE